MSEPLELSALDGANPLGFLAAIGTVALLSETDSSVKIGWRPRARWMPFLFSPNQLEESKVLRCIGQKLRGAPVGTEKERLREATLRRFAAAKTELKNVKLRFKARGLRGKERDAEWVKEVEPYINAFAAARAQRLTALKAAVPSPELALGDKPDCTIVEFREHALAILSQSKPEDRKAVDLLTSFGSELSAEEEERIQPTPLCFVNGSGKQWFLATARQLMTRKDPTKQEPSPPPCVTESNLKDCLFNRWTYSNDGLSMRWDPAEDIRYALRLDNPGPVGAYTIWMANLLAYHALAFFPCAPNGGRMMATGWANEGETERFTWPLWNNPLSVHTLRSLLSHPAFGAGSPSAYRHELRARGVAAIFCARRIQVGNPPLHKINFSPAEAV